MEYLDSSKEFESSVSELEQLEKEVAEIESRISEAHDRLAQAEADGDTALIDEIQTEIKMLYSDMAQTKDSVDQIQASGALEFEIYMPVNEVNFEAWKADKEQALFNEVTSKLKDDLNAEIERATKAEDE